LKIQRQNNMHMQQEQWVNEVMSSLGGLQKAEGNPFLHTRVLARLDGSSTVQRGSLKPLYALASVVLLVLMLNVFLWNQSGNRSVENSAVSTAVSEYDLTAIDY
jgi:hypothetical protein